MFLSLSNLTSHNDLTKMEEALSIVRNWEGGGKLQISLHTPQDLPWPGFCLLHEHTFHGLPTNLLGAPSRSSVTSCAFMFCLHWMRCPLPLPIRSSTELCIFPSFITQSQISPSQAPTHITISRKSLSHAPSSLHLAHRDNIHPLNFFCEAAIGLWTPWGPSQGCNYLFIIMLTVHSI